MNEVRARKAVQGLVSSMIIDMYGSGYEMHL